MLSRFFNTPILEILKLDQVTHYILADCYERINAREHLEQLQIISYPHSSKENQNKIFKDLKNKAYPTEERKHLSHEDANEAIKRVLNGR